MLKVLYCISVLEKLFARHQSGLSSLLICGTLSKRKESDGLLSYTVYCTWLSTVMDSKNIPIIFIGALLLVPLVFLAYYACRIMYHTKLALKDDVEMNYVELLKNEETSYDGENRPTSVCQFPFPGYGENEKCVYVKEARKLDFSSKEDLMNEVCVICTDSFTRDSRIVVLRCGHDFHEKCFRDWVVDKDTSPCPLCQQQVHIKTVVKWRVT